MVIFQSIVFCIKIKPPQKSPFSQHAIQENLSAIGIRNISYSGLCQVVAHWLNSQYLSICIDEFIIDLILASLYHDEKVQSIENGFLKFLHLLSFTNFEENYLTIGPKEELMPGLTQFEYDFKTKRGKFPALTIISKHDMESNSSKTLTESYFIRLVNCARMTLHLISQNMNFDDILNEKLKVNEDTFDAVLVLNHFQIPTDSKFGKCENASVFPVVNYDPVGHFWDELQQTFGTEVQFYFNSTVWRVGLKFSESTKMKAILEDIQILGKDLIKEVIIVNTRK